MKEPIHVKILRQSARAEGLYFKKFDPEGALHLVGDSKKAFLLDRAATELTSKISYILADNKRMTVSALDYFGLPVPKQKLVQGYEKAVDFFRRHCPVVVKPNKSSLGKGVTVGVKTIGQLKSAFEFAKKYGREILIEEFIPGEDFRVTVIDYKRVFVIKRVPAFVVGDGEHSVKFLVNEKNQIKKKYKKPIKLDGASAQRLKEQGYNFHSVLGKGSIAYLRRAANIAEGGTSIDCTDLISKELKALAIKACRALKLPCAGVDIITEDIGGNKGVIIEVNPRPHIVIHRYPHVGRARYPGREIMKMLFR